MTGEVRISVQGGVGKLILARPEALHALNRPMCDAILGALQAWAADPAISLVRIGHAPGTRGFCAGGDIRMLAASGAGDAAEARAFFRSEYRMNAALKAFPKPIVAIMDGVTMGGGVGLSVHGSHRIATERTLFAMPETGIGLFPDVGGGWFLPRLAGETGTWLALTGARLKGADTAAAGIATHYIESAQVAELEETIDRLGEFLDPVGTFEDILSGEARTPGLPSFAAEQDVIDTCFAGDSAEAIRDALLAQPGAWARAQAEALAAKSPETVKVALRQLREGARLEHFEDNMRMEFRIGWRKVQSHDFQEGVRAVIIDKDNAPGWRPARLEDVRDEDVGRYFAPLGDDELTFDTGK